MAKDMASGDTSNTISGGTQGPVLQAQAIRDVHFNTTVSAPVAPLALAQLPPVVAGFTGRDDELAVMTDLLDPAGAVGAVVVSAVAGLAGVGKTSLAVQASHAARERGWCRGGVLFIDLHGYDETPVQPTQALDALLRALGVPAEHIPPTAEERAGLYRSRLAGIAEPVLVIADNASAEAQVRPLLPGPGPHRVVVTSRHTLAGLDARLVDITVLDDAAGVELLDMALRTARPGDERITDAPKTAERLAGVCGGLPLALQIVAALLKADPALSAAELADELAIERERLERLQYDDGRGASAPSVAAAFELSYRRLDETFAYVFRLLPLNPGPDLSTAAAAILVNLPVTKVRRVLGGLAQAHLAEAAPGGVGRWRMHDLLRLYAQRLSVARADADGLEEARDRLLRYYLNMASAADDHLRALPGMAVPSEFSDRDNALAWLDAERPNLVAAVQKAADTGRDEVAIRLPVALADYFDWRGHLDAKLATTIISLDTARRLGDRPREAAALGNLGVTLEQLRRFEEAITTESAAATIFRQIGDRWREGIALTNLGLDLERVGRFEEAITAHQAANTIFRRIGKRQLEGVALNNLGGALADAGRFEEAITAHEESLAICRDIGYRQRESIAVHDLGGALAGMGRFEEAITAYEESIAICRDTGDRHGEGASLNGLGKTLDQLQRFEEAITAYQATADIFKEIGNRYGEGVALNNLGKTLDQLQRFEEAITAYQAAADIYQDAGERQREGTVLINLGRVLAGMGRFEEAITAHEESIAICRDIGDRRVEGTAMSELGRVLAGMGRFEEAITAHQAAADTGRDTGNRQVEGAALNNLGRALDALGQFDEAITAYQAAADIFRETGNQHVERAVLKNLESARARQLT